MIVTHLLVVLCRQENFKDRMGSVCIGPTSAIERFRQATELKTPRVRDLITFPFTVSIQRGRHWRAGTV